MKIARLSGLLLVALLAMSLVSVATASAAGSTNPLFVPANGQAATGVSGVSTLTTPSASITCKKDTATGNITSSLLLGKVFVHYLECTSTLFGHTNACTVKSEGAPEKGLIQTKELHAILGLLLPSLETGLLFLPVVPTRFVKIEAGEGTGECTPETLVTGNVLGLVTPVGVKTKTGEIRFPAGSEIDLTHGLGKVKAGLNAFAETASLSQIENVTFGEETEVT